MLTDINLDDESFEELVEEAKNMIVSYYSQWTDFNYHDPGITISELFAFMKEIIQYRMNYVGEAHKMKYLKLMGISRKPLTPATARLSLKTDQAVRLPALTRFFASGICFESSRSKYLAAGDIQGCIYTTSAGLIFLEQAHMQFRFSPFGEHPEPGNCLYLLFSESLPEDTQLSVYVQVYNEYKIMRNPIAPDQKFFDLAKMEMEAAGRNGFTKCREFQDETRGFLQSGWLNFTLNHPLEKTTVAGREGYFIRLKLINAVYDIHPSISSVSMNCLDVFQTRHYALYQDLECIRIGPQKAVCTIEANSVTSENLSVLIPDGDCWKIFEDYQLQLRDGKYVLKLEPDENGSLPEKVRVLAWEFLFDTDQMVGEGTGLPFQEYPLGDIAVEAESFCLMIEEPDREGYLREWIRVEDFSASGPRDCHYVLDSGANKIIFGDCFRGMAPEGHIFIARFVTCEGRQGNVKAGAIREIEQNFRPMEVVNTSNAWGGCDQQLLEDCFMDARRSLYENGSLVTDEDYENAVRHTPGLMIENCRVIYPKDQQKTESVKNTLTIVVKPFSFEKNPVLSSEYKKNIIAWLDMKRMIGTDIRLVSPEYLRLNVFVECKGRNNYIFDRKAIVGALNRYFASFGSNFGNMVSQSEVYEILDRLDAVESMEALSIDVVGSNVHRTSGGDIILPPNGLISPEDIAYNININ